MQRGDSATWPLRVVVALLAAHCESPGEPSPPVSIDPAATAPAGPSSRGPDVRSESPPVVRRPSSALLPLPSASAHPAPSTPPGLVPHPLADWMRGPPTRAFDERDLEGVAGSFEQMARWAPPGYANWTSICVDGAQAARVGNLEAVKAACRGCHGEYEERYKTELGPRPLP